MLFKNLQEKEKRLLYIYCDMHGHSKKKNSFFYGCNTAANGGFLSWTIVRLLPRIFAKKTHLFSYKDCRFKVEPYKLGTGRVVAWKQFQVTHSFTLESSFYGYDYGDEQSKIFQAEDYMELGIKLCQSIYELHFLWKQIRKELQVTNGWLKPRKLIELTGVPAAQILNEEITKKRKEDQKRKAIELYEQFLKKFYNAGAVSPTKKGIGLNNNSNGINSLVPGIAGKNQQQLVQMQTFSFKTEQGGSQNQNGSNNASQFLQIQIRQQQQTQSQFSIVPSYQNIPQSLKTPNPSYNQRLLTNKHHPPDAKLNTSYSFLEPTSTGPKGRVLHSSLYPPSENLHQQSIQMIEGAISVINEGDTAKKEGIIVGSGSGGETDYEDLFQKFQGIVKIQAIFRGYQVRKRIVLPKLYLQELSKEALLAKTLFKGKYSSKHQQSQAQLLQQQQEPPVFTNTLINTQVEKVTRENRRTQEQLAGLDGNEQFKMDIDWRQYFQEQELEEAFQKVEIEKTDDPNDGYSSGGSSSDPSCDNLDKHEILERIYELDNLLEFEEERLQLQAKFMDEFMATEPINQLSFMKRLEVTFNNKRSGGKGTDGMGKQLLIKNRRSTVRSPQKVNKNMLQGNQTENMQKDGNSSSLEKKTQQTGIGQQNGLTKEAIKSQRKTPYYQQFYLTGMQIDQNVLKKSNTQSPMTNDIDYPLIGHSILDPDRRNNQNSKYSQQQQRSLLSSGQNIQNLSYLHMKFLQQQQTGYNYRENINQVIKDCFITKKCGTTQQRIQSQIQRSKYQDGGNRLHSFNTYKGLIQKSNTSKKSKKNQKQRIPMMKQEVSLPPESVQMIEDALLMQEDESNEEGLSQLNPSSNVNIITTNGEGASGDPDQSQSSLFMRYVKQKIVKKMKQDSIPHQVADKYLNIYKELIDREQSKVKGLAYPVATAQYAGQYPQQAQKDLSSRSDYSNPKVKANLNRSRNGGGNGGPVQDRSPAKTMNTKMMNTTNGGEMYKEKGRDKEKPEQSYNASPLQFSSKMEQNSSSITRNIEGGGGSVLGDTYFRQNNNKSYMIASTQQQQHSQQQQLQEQAKVKFPLINNFSSTLDYRKKSREIINDLKQLKTSQNQLAQYHNPNQQPYNSMLQKSYEDQVRASYQDIQQEDAYLQINYQNNHQNPQNPPNFGGNMKAGGQLEENSIASSIDQEMIENIKNIYQEMKKTTKNQQYSNSFSGKQQIGKQGFMKQKRLLQKQPNDELMNMLPSQTYDDILQQYQQQSIGVGSQFHSKSLNYGYNMNKGRNINNSGTSNSNL